MLKHWLWRSKSAGQERHKMLPDNVLSSKVLQAKYIYPDGILFNRPYQDYELGGIALQDTSRGLMYQTWLGEWDKNTGQFFLYPNLVSAPINVFNQADVFELSFAFDQNMRWVAGTLATDGVFRLRWYDSAVGGYVISTYPGITAFKLSMDDKRDFVVQSGKSDVLLTYIQDNKLYVRVQRERFLIPHLLQADLPNNLIITNFGMHERLRMQWRLRYRRPGELLPWL